MRPEKIISGGQTGADQGGLEAARYLDIPTGGTAPFTFWTDEGSKPTLLRYYGLTEGKYDPQTYPKRTWENVRNSDGTVLFGNTSSPGTRLTIKYCKTCLKPYIENPTPQQLKEWVIQDNIKVLNVAGNRERTNPGIKQKVVDIIVEAFKDRGWSGGMAYTKDLKSFTERYEGSSPSFSTKRNT